MSEEEVKFKLSEKEINKVKLYVLNDQELWDDKGTAQFSRNFFGDNSNEISILSEDDGSKLFNFCVNSRDSDCEKQGEGIIIFDRGFALSFMSYDTCNLVWARIQDIKERYESDLQNYSDTSYEEVHDPYAAIELPPCELSKLDDIFKLIQGSGADQQSREKISSVLRQECYIPKLIELFHMCEDLENKEGLHILFSIFTSLFLMDQNDLFEVMFLPQNIIDIVGILEYDPSKNAVASYREFLNESVQFKEIVQISNRELSEKIHQTHRIQYIKDILVPVPSLFDGNMPTLSSFLFFNKVSIVQLIQEDPHFLEDLFEKLTDDEISDEQRKEAMLLLKELCTFSQSLQDDDRDKFIHTLAEHGLLQALEQLMNIEDLEMRGAIVDIIITMVELNPSFLRDYLCREADPLDEDSMLLNMLIDMLLNTSNSGLGFMISKLIQSLLDPQSMGLGQKQTEKTEFLAFFYRNCMNVLTAPIFAATTGNVLVGRDDFEQATMLDHIVEILTFCVQNHQSNMKTYVVSKDMLRRVLVLMQSRHKFLVLGALRFCRRIIGLEEEFLNRYIIVGKLLTPVVEAFISNGSRYNLVNSAIIELFNFICNADINPLISHIVDNHMDVLRGVTYVGTFTQLERKYEQEKDRVEEDADRVSVPSAGIIHDANSARRKRDDRTLDEYEENWFNCEEEDLDAIPIPLATMSRKATTAMTTKTPDSVTSMEHDSVTTKPLSAKLKDVDLIDSLPVKRSESPPLLSVNRASSPNGTHPTICRPGSPQNTRQPGSPTNSVTTRPLSPINKSTLKPINPQNSPIFENTLNNKNCANNKQGTMSFVNNIVKNNNTKPLIQFRINSNSIIKSENQPTANGITSPVANTNSLDKTNHTCKTDNAIVKKPLFSLVDYPDDDDITDEEDAENHEDEIPSSPAKKQRIGST